MTRKPCCIGVSRRAPVCFEFQLPLRVTAPFRPQRCLRSRASVPRPAGGHHAAMVEQQVALVLSREPEGRVLAVDMHTGAAVTTYKGCCSGPRCMALVGEDQFAAAQSDKRAIMVWAWHKDTPVSRSFTAEPVAALAATPCGTMLAAGGASGFLYLWETSTGQLLRQWPAHYKSVSCLRVSSCGHFLISGGEDTQTHVWALLDVLDPATPESQAPQPHWSHSEHTLFVADIAVGAPGPAALFVTCAGDAQFAVCSLGFCEVLRKGTLPGAATCAALDPFEHAVYFGSEDGSVYFVDLLTGTPAPQLEAGSDRADATAVRVHKQRVNSVAVSTDGCFLVTGSDDGTMRIVDIQSRQVLRDVAHPSRAAVTHVACIDRPLFMISAGTEKDGTTRMPSPLAHAPSLAASRRGPRRSVPVAPLAKFLGPVSGSQPWEGPLAMLGSREAAHGDPSPLVKAGVLRGASGGVEMIGGAGASGSGQARDRLVEVEGQVEALREELARATHAAEQWRSQHAELHAFCVEAVLAQRGSARSGKG